MLRFFMNKPTPEDLQNFFSSDIFQSESVRNGDYTAAIKAFYDQFYPEFEQSKYNAIGIHVDNIRQEELVVDEQTDNSYAKEYKTIIDFHFILDPANQQSFSLIGTDEQKSFFDFNREELLDFLILKFRRFSKLFTT